MRCDAALFHKGRNFYICRIGGIAISFPLPVYTADDNGGLCIGRRCINAPEGLGAAAVNKRASVYTEALLAHYYQRL